MVIEVGDRVRVLPNTNSDWSSGRNAHICIVATVLNINGIRATLSVKTDNFSDWPLFLLEVEPDLVSHGIQLIELGLASIIKLPDGTTIYHPKNGQPFQLNIKGQII